MTLTDLPKTARLYPWFKFFQSLTFWQAIWFLYFQAELSAAEAILLYVVADVASTVLEVPSGYMSDRLGRKRTLICAVVAGVLGTALLAVGGAFAVFALGQVLLGAATAFASGTDSAILYESLAAEGREDEIEVQELKAWRATYLALGVSAVTGGAAALVWMPAPFVMTALAFAAALFIVLRLDEPPHAEQAEAGFGSLKAALVQPVLGWLFVLSVLMYGFSHLPFVFGQPFILEALERMGLAGEAPLVSGTVSALMMGLSVVTSLFARRLRLAVGLPVILLFAFGMQIALAAVMALSNAGIVIAFLFLRMVPDSLSRPFILARIQPMIEDDSRATYLSLQSLVGRLLFAASLWLAAQGSSAVGEMSYAEISTVLSWYVAVGVLCLIGLGLAAAVLKIDADQDEL